MTTAYARRLLSGCAFAAAGLLAVGPTAAAAAEPTHSINTVVNDVTVVPGPGGTTADPLIFGAGVAGHPVFTYDLSGLPTGVTAKVVDDTGSPFTCDPQVGKTITCTGPIALDLQFPDTGPALTLIADNTATVGATGTLRATIGADGEATNESASKVTVGEGVDLTAGPKEVASLKPGGLFHPRWAVRNSSEKTTAHGVVLDLFTLPGVGTTKQYSNCLYGVPHETYCVFDTELMPGKTYGFPASFNLQVATDMLAPERTGAVANWMTPQEWADLKASLTRLHAPLPTTPGSGGPLMLSEIATPAAMSVNPPQGDPNPDDNVTAYAITVTGSNPADLAAIGATASGAAGASVNIKVGVKNNGPATVRPGLMGLPFIVVPEITIPDGTTATAAPDTCVPETGGGVPGTPGARTYLCVDLQDAKAGETVWFSFTLHIDKTVSNATGTISLYGPEERGSHTGDTNKANDTASIVINPTGGGTGGGGGLPVTGTQTGLIAAAGIALLAVGVGLRILARRRVAPGTQD